MISDSSWLISAWKANVSVSSAMMVDGRLVGRWVLCGEVPGLRLHRSIYSDERRDGETPAPPPKRRDETFVEASVTRKHPFSVFSAKEKTNLIRKTINDLSLEGEARTHGRGKVVHAGVKHKRAESAFSAEFCLESFWRPHKQPARPPRTA
jgi:hypothetical protein